MLCCGCKNIKKERLELMAAGGSRPSPLKSKRVATIQRSLSVGRTTTVNDAKQRYSSKASAILPSKECNGKLQPNGTPKSDIFPRKQQRHTVVASSQATSQKSSTTDQQRRQPGGGGSSIRSSSSNGSARNRRLQNKPTGRTLDMGMKPMAQANDDSVVQTVEILKRPGQSLGFYIREGNGSDRSDGVFISRIGPGSVVENNKLLHVGDEILTINSVDLGRIGIDDVVILMSIPKRLVLTIRTWRGSKNASCPSLCTLQPEETPVFVKKGRSSSATAVEMTEKCPDEFYLAAKESTSAYNKMAPGYIQKLEETRRSKFAQQPPPNAGYKTGHGQHHLHQPQQHHIPADDSGDSGLSSENSGYSQKTYEGSSQGSQPVTTPSGGDMLDRAVDDIEGMCMPGSSGRSPRMSPHGAGNGSIPSQGVTYRSPALVRRETGHNSTPAAHYQHEYASDIESSTYDDTYNGRRHDHHNHHQHQAQPKQNDINSLKAFQDEIERTHSRYEGYVNTRHKFSKSRSASPDCYNSDTEVLYRNSGPHGARSSHTASPRDPQLQHIMSDGDASRCNSLPRDSHGPVSSNVSGGDEIKHWLKKFDTWSNELKADEQQRLASTSPTTTGAYMGVSSLTMGRPSSALHRSTSSGTPSPTTPDTTAKSSEEYYAWLSNKQLQLAQRAAEFRPSRTNHANTLGHGRVTRKHSADSLMDYRTYQLEDPADSTGGGQMDPARYNYTNTTTHTTSGTTSAHGNGNKISHSYTSLNSLPNATGSGHAPKTYRDPDSGKNMAPPSSRLRDLQLSRKPVTVRVEDYRLYQPEVENRRVPVDRPLEGVLHVHVLCGHGLKSSRTMLRDLYCVIEVDALNKARTMIRTGAINFDWDEAFDMDLDGAAREVSFLVYSWDPNTRHKLCFSALVILQSLLQYGSSQRVGLKLEPKGILYLDIQYREAAVTLQRTPSLRKSAMFGVDLQTLINREKSGCAVPLLVKMCVDEVERRGLDHVGIYRLCGAARRKAQLRSEFENSARTVDLSPDNVSDINVITGVLKDFLRELPEPLFTNALYRTLLDALSVRIPQDPSGSARLMLGILDCLPKANQETMMLLLDHLKRVSQKADVNKMTSQNLAVCFGPVLLCPSPTSATDMEAVMDFKRHIEVLHYLLDIWPGNRAIMEAARRRQQGAGAVDALGDHRSQALGRYTPGGGGDAEFMGALQSLVSPHSDRS